MIYQSRVSQNTKNKPCCHRNEKTKLTSNSIKSSPVSPVRITCKATSSQSARAEPCVHFHDET